MKRVVLGTLVGVGLVTAALSSPNNGRRLCSTCGPGLAGRRDGRLGTDCRADLVGEKSQMLTVVDPRQRVLSVYHIDLTTGKITLKSVRNIQWDLQMAYLNNENPLPQEIRSLLEQR